MQEEETVEEMKVANSSAMREVSGEKARGKRVQIKKRTYSYLRVNIVCEFEWLGGEPERFGAIISHEVDPKAGNVQFVRRLCLKGLPLQWQRWQGCSPWE